MSAGADPKYRLTRRDLLLGGGAYTLASAIPAYGRSTSASPAAWHNLATSLRGHVLRPGDSGFTRRMRPNNLRYANIVPAGIVRCQDETDVARALRWAEDVGMPLAIRSGGHSYAGCSTTSGLLLDLSLMHGVRVQDGVVEFDGGALNAHAYATLRPARLTLTHGRCFGVGVSAFLMGGGIGFGMRDHGIGCDAVVRARMVTARGEVLSVSTTENPNLYWALRGGGGGNFGIATMFAVRPVQAEPVCIFDLTWSTRPEEVFHTLMTTLDHAPERMGSRVAVAAVTPQELRAGHDCEVKLLGQLRGRREEVDSILAPVYAVATPAHERIQDLDYWDAQRALGEPGPPGRYQEKSRYCEAPISTAAANEMFRWARKWPGTTRQADFKFFHVGGRIKAFAPEATAYIHRDADWLFSVELNWSETDTSDQITRNLEWQEGFYESVYPMLNKVGGAYQNFVDPTLVDAPDAYFGANLNRLREIKTEIDPNNVFRAPRGISII